MDKMTCNCNKQSKNDSGTYGNNLYKNHPKRL